MLEYTLVQGQEIHYRISGSLTTESLRAYYAKVEKQYRRYGKVRLLASATSFRGYAGLRAVLVLLRGEPRLLRWVERYALVTEQRGLRLFFRVLAVVIPFPLAVFREGEEAAARRWLT